MQLHFVDDLEHALALPVSNKVKDLMLFRCANQGDLCPVRLLGLRAPVVNPWNRAWR